MDDPRNLYLLQDGTQAEPRECAPDEKGVLRHKNGLAVCMSEAGTPQTIGKNAEVSGNVASAPVGTGASAAPASGVVESSPVNASTETKVD